MSKQHFQLQLEVLVDCPCAARGGGASCAVPVSTWYLEPGFHGVPDCQSFILDSHPTCLWVRLWALKTMLPLTRAIALSPRVTLCFLYFIKKCQNVIKYKNY
jgi:hypothetical protein